MRVKEEKKLKGLSWDKISNKNDAIINNLNWRSNQSDIKSNPFENGQINGDQESQSQKENYEP